MPVFLSFPAAQASSGVRYSPSTTPRRLLTNRSGQRATAASCVLLVRSALRGSIRRPVPMIPVRRLVASHQIALDRRAIRGDRVVEAPWYAAAMHLPRMIHYRLRQDAGRIRSGPKHLIREGAAFLQAAGIRRL